MSENSSFSDKIEKPYIVLVSASDAGGAYTHHESYELAKIKAEERIMRDGLRIVYIAQVSHILKSHKSITIGTVSEVDDAE